ncbi:MAG: tetratricopeptide repeat protein [Candidatus Sulfotelmatobacter sp.]
MKTLGAIASVLLSIFSFQTSSFTQAPGQQQQPEFVKQGQQLIREGEPDDALALYRKTLQTSPNSVPANIAAGSVLDLMGKGEEAWKYFSKAIEVADTPEHKAGAQRGDGDVIRFRGKLQKGNRV